MSVLTVLIVVAGVAIFADGQRAEAGSKGAKKAAGYAGPGLGEIMGVIQQHHAKLFFAGQAGNWDLARYQLDEIKEGFEMAENLHPNFKTVSTPLPKIIPVMMAKSIDDLSADIQQKNKDTFLKGFDALSHACNNCHRATKFDFIVIQRPSSLEHSNMMFDTKRAM